MVVLLSVSAALVASYLQDPVYEGEVRLLLHRRDAESPFESTPSAQPDPSRAIKTEMEVIKSPPVHAAVREQLRRVAPISVTAVTGADLIKIKARSSDARLAASSAKAYGTAYVDFRRSQAVEETRLATGRIEGKIAELERQIRGLESEIASQAQPQRAAALEDTHNALVSQQAVFKRRLDELQVEAELKSGGAELITTGRVPTVQVAPTPLRSSVIALGLGLVVGIGLALLLESLDRSVKSKDQLEEIAPGLPVLGLIPQFKRSSGRKSHITALSEPGSVAAESFRSLRTALQFIGVSRAPKIFQVTSTGPGEGKSLIVSNLAVVLAGSGQRVLLVDCDLRRPRLHEYFGVSADIGFTSVFLGHAEPDAAIQVVDGAENLSLMASGPLPPDPSALLADRRTGEVLSFAQRDFDVVLVDSPPVLAVTDPVALSVWVEATVLVVLAGRTSRQGLARAVEVLRQGEAPLVGTVLNRVPREDPYTSYQYGYGDNGQRSKSPEERPSRRRTALPDRQ